MNDFRDDWQSQHRVPYGNNTGAPGDQVRNRGEQDDVVLATIGRGPADDREKEQLQIRLRHYMGKPFVDCRVFFRDQGGTYKPTSKGSTVRAHELRTVLAALRDAAARLGVPE